MADIQKLVRLAQDEADDCAAAYLVQSGNKPLAPRAAHLYYVESRISQVDCTRAEGEAVHQAFIERLNAKVAQEQK